MRFIVVVWATVFFALPASAQGKRVALVIGNSAYQHTTKLTNPANDAMDVAISLKALGFVVVEGFDLEKPAFERKVREFATALAGAEAGIFFYAGHGLQVAGKNYLIPVDAKLEDSSGLDFETIQLDLIHRTMERQTSTNIIFIDACRDNPLGRNLARSMGTRSTDIGKGLALVEGGVGTLISFSTQPGNIALDGTGRNSPFAGALVRQLMNSGEDLGGILIEVRNDVMRETQQRQIPWEHSALRGRFYFNPGSQPAAKAAPARLGDAAEAWDRTKDTKSTSVLEAFAARYADTIYANLARARIEQLAKVVVAKPQPSRSVGFDGRWHISLHCPNRGGTKGYSRRLSARVKDGVLSGEDGSIGRPLYMAIDGTIDPNGNATFAVQGLTGGDPDTSTGRPSAGTSFQYGVSAQFSGKQGTGKRVTGRECNFLFAKQ